MRKDAVDSRAHVGLLHKSPPPVHEIDTTLVERAQQANSPSASGQITTRLSASVAIELDRLHLFSAVHAASLFAPRCAARVIFLASDDRTLRRHLDCYADRLHAITLVPLARRSHELPRLLQRLWRDELGSSHRVDVLGARALGGIAAHGWRGNFDELRAMAARLLAYVEHRTLHGAACALWVRRQTLSQHLARIGVWSGGRSERGC